MFAALKNKIKEETGSDLNSSSTGLQLPYQCLINNYSNENNHVRNRFSSMMSVNSYIDYLLPAAESEQLCHFRSQCNELSTKVANLNRYLQQLQQEKTRVDKTNEILLESVKVAQTQKHLYCEEQGKIQNLQQQEIEKLRSLLLFREQEAVDRLNAMRQLQQQTEQLTQELERLKHMELMVEDLRDELERLRHATQLDKNHMTITLAAVEEENRHLKMRMQIVEATRLETLTKLNAEEQLKALLQERKLLEQHLEETHLQLSDIKSSWSGQNLALETQLSRLSKQVAEETTEKHKALKSRDDANERMKHLQFKLQKLKDAIQQRDDKINLLEEEVDELNLMLKECREENEQQILFERNKVETLEMERKDLKTKLEVAEERFSEFTKMAEQVAQKLRQQNSQQQLQLDETLTQLESEREEKLTALLRNAEISQSEELLNKQLRMERDESNELHEQSKRLQSELSIRKDEIIIIKNELEMLKAAAATNEQKVQDFNDLQQQMNEKNKTIKILNQRLVDLKKTLQKEFRQSTQTLELGAVTKQTDNDNKFFIAPSAANFCNYHTNNKLNSSGIIMDEVNFKYLKHVIIKFLTSREMEARHLIPAVATLLQMTTDEEKLLHDTLNWKMSWFGSKPDHGSGQHAFSIPPS